MFDLIFILPHLALNNLTFFTKEKVETGSKLLLTLLQSQFYFSVFRIAALVSFFDSIGDFATASAHSN
jgi:hypothetical protein